MLGAHQHALPLIGTACTHAHGELPAAVVARERTHLLLAAAGPASSAAANKKKTTSAAAPDDGRAVAKRRWRIIGLDERRG